MTALLALALLAQEKFYIGHHEKFVNITFQSDTDLETIVGHANKATGELDAGSVSITVPVKDMTTGIAMRDDHMRSAMWLDAEKHPTIVFKAKKVEPVKDKPGRYAVTGDFTLHGVTKETTVEVESKEIPSETAKKAKFPDGKWLRFTAEWKVKLADYGIKMPDVAFGKVSEEWTVKMTVFAGTAKLPEKK